MKYFSISRLADRSYDNIEKNIVIIFKNINEYEEEVYDLLEKNNISLSELESHVKSWGGEVETLLMRDLVKDYLKRKTKNDLENR